MTTAPATSPTIGKKPPLAPPGVRQQVRISHLLEMKKSGRPITMLTAYDATMAKLLDEGSIDLILVGDSLGNAVYGMEDTLGVTMEMMVLHTRAVTSGAKRPFIVTDMPFLSYNVSVEQALANAGRLVQEGGADGVKVECFSERPLPMIEAMVHSAIPVVGHIGLVPQAVHAMSGYRVQGRSREHAERLKELALKVEKAGAFMLVLEGMPSEVAAEISKTVKIPAIGIGAGAGCDGQVLVINDLLGLTGNPPKFVRQYADLKSAILRAVRKYTRDVREGYFPSEKETYQSKPESK